MTNNISSMLNSKLRFSGLSSGLDTDTIIQQLMNIEKMKVNKVRQDRTLLEWKRDDYRSIINSLRSFQDEFFNSIKSSTNFRSASAFASFDTTSDNPSIATVTAGAGATPTTHSLYVNQLATAAKVTSTTAISGTAIGSMDISDFSLQGKQINITLDGVKKTINLEDYAGIGDLQTKLQSAIDAAFGKTGGGASKLEVLTSGNKIEFKAGLDGSTFDISEPINNFISALGFANDQQNYIAGKDITVTDNTDLNGKFKIKLDGTEKEITLSGLSSASSLDDVKTAMQNAIDSDFGAGNVIVSLNGSKLEILSQNGQPIVLSSSTTNNILNKLGFSTGASVTATSFANINFSGNEKGKTFALKINGTEKLIELSGDHADINSLQADIQSQLGGTNVSVNVSGNKLVFASSDGSKIIFKQGPVDALSKLGFASTDNTSNKISLSASLDSIESQFTTPVDFDAAANVQFSINGTVINLNKTFAQASINDVISAINGSNAGVEMKYDSLNDKFTLTSKKTGASESITITDTDPTDGLLKSLGIEQANVQAGKDAIFKLDGIENMQRSSNEFSISGVNYVLKSDASPATEVKITVNTNADNLVEKIKNFVGKYNEVIDKINGELSEKRERDYTPLTDEQKESMKDEDIKKWEEKARSGLLKNDDLLGSVVSNMRRALSDMVSGVSTSLSKIGITTGTYEMKGKLIIDETKLKAAIKDNVDGVVQLFTQDSQYSYNDGLSDSAKRKSRYQEVGLANRLYDILQDNIRTIRDDGGKKGALLEKAGIAGDITEFDNIMNDSMKVKDKLINNLLDKMINKENDLYRKFTAMEKALSEMNSQSSWLSQQFGGQQ